MTLEELYLVEKDRIKKLSLYYARMFHTEPQDLFQEGALAVVEAYARYAELPDGDLLRVTRRIINRKIYRYAREEYRHKRCRSNATGKY